MCTETQLKYSKVTGHLSIDNQTKSKKNSEFRKCRVFRIFALLLLVIVTNSYGYEVKYCPYDNYYKFNSPNQEKHAKQYEESVKYLNRVGIKLSSEDIKITQVSCDFDINEDGKISVADFAALVSKVVAYAIAYNNFYPNCQKLGISECQIRPRLGDMNGDGLTDWTDEILFLQRTNCLNGQIINNVICI